MEKAKFLVSCGSSGKRNNCGSASPQGLHRRGGREDLNPVQLPPHHPSSNEDTMQQQSGKVVPRIGRCPTCGRVKTYDDLCITSITPSPVAGTAALLACHGSALGFPLWGLVRGLKNNVEGIRPKTHPSAGPPPQKALFPSFCHT